MIRRYGFAVVSSVFLAAFPAAAGDVQRARELFSDGLKRFEKGDFMGAVRAFRAADAEHHASPITYNIGLAEEKLGHPQAAVDAYEAYLAEAGETGDMSSPASAAIAQLKARSTRLRIETSPPGARVFVDGSTLAEPSPVTVLVAPGHHVVVVQHEGWRDERELEARGAGDQQLVRMGSGTRTSERPKPGEQQALAGPGVAAQEGPSDLVWGAAFSAAPIYMLGATAPGAPNGKDAWSVIAGLNGEFGLAITEHIEVMVKGFVGIGPDRKPCSYAYLGGPSISFRVARPLWIGTTFLGGELVTGVPGGVTYTTDQVFGMMLDAMVAIVSKPSGQWLLGVQPTVLVTNRVNDNTSFFFPIALGYRSY